MTSAAIAMDRRPDRFEARRARIIGAATRLLNEKGVRGMTLSEVAGACDMATTGIAYYFGRKEDLAAACFVDGLKRFEAMVREASAPHAARERLSRLWELYFDHKLRVGLGQAREMPIFSDIRTLEGSVHTQVADRYTLFFRSVRELLRTPDLRWLRGDAAGARTHLILEHLYWLNAWLPGFESEDFPRVRARMLDVLFNGVATQARPLSPALDPPTRKHRGDAPNAFLIAITREINTRGYKGASVDRISASLQRTKGAFYHHASSKNDLVVAGFERTFDILLACQSAAMRASGDAHSQLQTAVVTLLDFQLSSLGPLMRTSALQSLPMALRIAMIERSNRVAIRFAGMISDGASQGVLRVVDPVITAQMITASINAVADARRRATGSNKSPWIEHYATPILGGLFAPANAPQSEGPRA